MVDDDFEIDIYIKLNDTIAKKDVVVALRGNPSKFWWKPKRNNTTCTLTTVQADSTQKESYRIYEKKGKLWCTWSSATTMSGCF